MKWLNGILNRIWRSRLKYLMKFVSFLQVNKIKINYCWKKSSGRIDPNNKPWLELKETTPYPKRSGLILLSNTTTLDLDGVGDVATGLFTYSINNQINNRNILVSLNAYIHIDLHTYNYLASKNDKEQVSSSFLSTINLYTLYYIRIHLKTLFSEVILI